MRQLKEIFHYLQKEGILGEPDGTQIPLKWEWYTPNKYIKAIRRTLNGRIDIDPATSEIAQKRIKAEVYYTRETDGLNHEWHGNLWLNPTYRNPSPEVWVKKAIKEYSNYRVKRAVIQVHLSTPWEPWFQLLLKSCHAACFVKEIIEWIPSWRGYEKDLKALGWDPDTFPNYEIHPVVFFYLGDDPRRFKKVFSKFGVVWRNMEGIKI